MLVAYICYKFLSLRSLIDKLIMQWIVIDVVENIYSSQKHHLG